MRRVTFRSLHWWVLFLLPDDLRRVMILIPDVCKEPHLIFTVSP